MNVEHDGIQIECEVLDLPVIEVLSHDFLVCEHSGSCHLVMREATPVGLVTLWDCTGVGHVYSVRDSVRVARPTNITDRAWPVFDDAFLDGVEIDAGAS